VQLSDQHKFVLFMILKDQNERLDIADLDNQELFFGQTVEALLPTLTEYDLIEFDKSENAYFLTTEGYEIAEAYEADLRHESNWEEEPIPEPQPRSIFDRRGFMGQVATALFFCLLFLARFGSRNRGAEIKFNTDTQTQVKQLIDSLREAREESIKDN